MISKRASGIVMPIFTLPNKEGIGTLGESAYQFIDFLSETNQTFWQILPIGYTSYGDSPYQSYSTYAGNPYFIDLEQLVLKGWLDISDISSIKWGEEVDYALLWDKKYELLFKAYKQSGYTKFQQQEALKKYWWLDDVSTFMGLKKHFGHTSRSTWEQAYTKEMMTSDLEDMIKEEKAFHIFLQEEFFEQWFILKEYAIFKGVQIIGDIPIFVAEDSADVWANPQYFQLKDNKTASLVAGVPPDYFSETGQLWGNPLYQWKNLEQDHFSWWITRIKEAAKLYDVIRIDHFRGFESFWAIPAHSKTAIDGKWVKAPGNKLFKEIKKQLPDIRIVAEDLGVITPEVQQLIDKNNFPGMKVLQFGFDSENTGHRPDQIKENTVYYTATHDNDTTEGWASDPKNANAVKNARTFFNITNTDICGTAQIFVEAVWSSKAIIAMTTVQDILELDTSARVNTPSTSHQNWKWRMSVLPPDNIKKWLNRITKENLRD